MTWFFGSAQSVCSALSTRCGTTWPSVESRVSYRPASAAWRGGQGARVAKTMGGGRRQSWREGV